MAKIGRNSPCPCGSGIKYKKCCLNKPQVPNVPDRAPFRKPLMKPTINNMIYLDKPSNSNIASDKKKPKRRRNHYVPIWYQKDFLSDDISTLQYLNLKPFKLLPDGKRIKLRELYEFGPRNCFYKKDLYTTKFKGIRNEEIEEFLFGKIDNNGRDAIHSFVNQDFKKLSKYFKEVFVYMDAQKLRTPKGLSWIRSNYFDLSHSDLMLEMQYLRTMHCTMWFEGVMEIVSAEASEVKFITKVSQ